MTVSFRTLWAVCLGAFFGAIILHVATGEPDYRPIFHMAFMVGFIQLLMKLGWMKST